MRLRASLPDERRDDDAAVTVRRVWRGRARPDPDPAADQAPAAPGRPGLARRSRWPRLLEQAAYWLLYIVAFPAALLHWRAGNEGTAVLCALAAVAGITAIAACYRRS